MFRKINLPRSFKNKNEKTIFNDIINNNKNNDFYIDNYNINELFKNVSGIEEYSILFLIHQMVLNNDYVYPIKDIKYGGIPSKDNFEFVNPKTGYGIEIFHAHICEETQGVLIWYHIFDDLGLRLNFEYHKPHPPSYQNILKRIINQENSYSIDPFIPLSEKYSYLRECIITSFENFIKIWK